jgi:collagenase-like PrtC family protease
VFSVEYLPGQYDQRADSAEQCIKLLNDAEEPLIHTATTYVIEGDITEEELAAAVSYCHLRGVKVYVTLNTLANDREMAAAAEHAVHASKMGVDAVLVQDLGIVRVLRQVAPDLPVHASTQMSIHNLEGVKAAADLGMTRAVLARELSRKDIAFGKEIKAFTRIGAPWLSRSF